MSIAQSIRESFLNGGEWHKDLVSRRFPGASHSNLSLLIHDMTAEGYEFSIRKLDPDAKISESVYKLTDHRPTEERIEEGRKRLRAQRGDKKQKASKRPPAEISTTTTDLGPLPDPATLPPIPHATPSHPRIIRDDPLPTPCPDFGSHLRVVLLSEADNGVITVGLRNGKTTYVAELVGIHTGE